MTRSLSSNQQPGFNFAINGFRGLCVLLVFAYHVANSGLPGLLADHAHRDAPLAFFASSWRYGVEMFFMISGFVIIASLQRHRDIGSFLRDRFIRIFPAWIPLHLALFTMGVVLGVKFYAELNASQLSIVFFTNLLLVAPLLPLDVTHPASWSLSYEWLFYFVAAAGFWLFMRMPRSVPTTVLKLGWAALILFLLYFLPRGLFFVPGVLVALGWSPFQRWPQLLRWPVLSLMIFLCAWRLVNVDQARPGAYSLVTALADGKTLFAVLAFIAGLHLFACVSADNQSVKLLRGRSLQFFGTISYSFYLWHPVAMFLVKRPIESWLVPVAGGWVSVVTFTVGSLALGTFAAWFSYQVFEQRAGRALKHWFDNRFDKKRMAQKWRDEQALPAAHRAASSLPASVEGS